MRVCDNCKKELKEGSLLLLQDIGSSIAYTNPDLRKLKEFCSFACVKIFVDYQVKSKLENAKAKSNGATGG